MASKFPRRKVESSREAYAPNSGCTVYFECKLACGHEILAYGMAPRGSPYGRKMPPKTCECRKCAQEQP